MSSRAAWAQTELRAPRARAELPQKDKELKKFQSGGHHETSAPPN